MIAVKTTKDYHIMIDKFIERNKDKTSSTFITELVHLLTEIEDTYSCYGRVIINYLIYKLIEVCNFEMIYKIHIEIISIRYDINSQSDISLRVYTINTLKSEIDKTYKSLVKDKHFDKEDCSLSSVFSVEYIDDLVIYFRRRAFVILTSSDEKNYRAILSDIVKFTKFKKIEFVTLSKQKTLFPYKKKLDIDRYCDLTTSFADNLGIEAFLSECVIFCADLKQVDPNDSKFDLSLYESFISRSLIEDFTEYMIYTRKNIDQIIINSEWFMDSTLNMVERFRHEIESKFNINIRLHYNNDLYKSKDIFRVYSDTYQRLRNSILINYILIELTDLIIMNMLSEITTSMFENTIYEIDEIIDKYMMILKIMEGERIDEYYCKPL